MQNNEKIIKLLQESPYFQNMEADELSRLLSFSSLVTYDRDSIVFFQSEDAVNMHILLEGDVRVYKSKSSGGEVQLLRESAVASIAELACFEKIPYPANCITLTQAKILKIPFDLFEKEFLSDPQISFGIIKSLGLKLRSLSSLIDRELTLSSEQKIAKYLVDNQNSLKSIKQVAIASDLNITPETLSRMLKKLQKRGMLESTSPLIITDIEGLKKVYDFF